MSWRAQAGRVPADRLPDELEVLARPRDRAAQSLLDADAGLESELRSVLGGGAVAAPGVIPGAPRQHGERRGVAGQPVDAVGEVADGRLDAARDVIGLARPALEGARDQPLDHVVDVDEVARGDALVLERQRL